MWKQE